MASQPSPGVTEGGTLTHTRGRQGPHLVSSSRASESIQPTQLQREPHARCGDTAPPADGSGAGGGGQTCTGVLV